MRLQLRLGEGLIKKYIKLEKDKLGSPATRLRTNVGLHYMPQRPGPPVRRATLDREASKHVAVHLKTLK